MLVAVPEHDRKSPVAVPSFVYVTDILPSTFLSLSQSTINFVPEALSFPI